MASRPFPYPEDAMGLTIWTHRKRDGSVERTVRSLNPSVSTDQRENDIAEGLALTKKGLRDKYGWSRNKRMRLVARIPGEVVAHCLKNHGEAAAKDTKFLLRHAESLGIDCRVSKGRF